MRTLLWTFTLLLLIPVAAFADEAETYALRGARILTAAGKVYDPGMLVIADGKIAAVGPAEGTAVPDGIPVRDVAGRVIIPGLVDSHSHLGVYSRPGVPANKDGNEMTGPVQSIVRALDAVNPHDPGIRMANAGGVTTANIMPGSGNVIGGQTIYVKLRGNTIEEMHIEAEDVAGGLKMANGENPKRVYGSRSAAPSTRMKIAALQRAEFYKAKDYLRTWDNYRAKLAAGKDAPRPPVDISLEPLVEVLQKKRTVHFHTHRADDILTVLRLRKEFDFELLIQHGTESYKVLDEIAASGVPVSMTIVDSPGGKAEVVDFIEECGAELSARGIKVLVNTDDPITESRFFLRTTAIAVRGGLAADEALKSITLYPAQTMHLDHRLGSLEAGKDADFVVLSGAPFSAYTRVLETYIDGKQVFDYQSEATARYQTGGFALPDHRREALPETGELIEPRPRPVAPKRPENAATPKPGDGEFVILAGNLHTVANGTISNGAVWVKDGKIKAAGKRDDLDIPAGLPVVSVAAATPGLIDAYSVVPLAGEYNIPADQDQDETSDPNQADARVLDGFNPAEPLLRYLLQQGVTLIHACPGRANVIAGTTGVFRTHGGNAEEMAVRFPQAVLFNLGEIPKSTYERKRPGTRMGTAAFIRQALTDAANDRRKRADTSEGETPPPRDLKAETLAKLLDRELPAVFVAQRADDLVTALRIRKEFDMEAMLALAAEAYLVADEIAEAGVPVVVHPTMQRLGSIETYNTILGNAKALTDKAITVAIGSGVESYVPKTRVIRFEASLAMLYGSGFEQALRAITLDAARILGVDDRFGSIEAGKVADLVLYDGDPFEHTTHVTHVYVDGRPVYERAKRPEIPLAERLRLISPEMPCCIGF